jgi:hypothetical protein
MRHLLALRASSLRERELAWGQKGHLLGHFESINMS